MADPRKKVANGLVALSSAAVMAVYGAGYARTRAAADRFAEHTADRGSRAPLPHGNALALGAEPEPAPPVVTDHAAAATDDHTAPTAPEGVPSLSPATASTIPWRPASSTAAATKPTSPVAADTPADGRDERQQTTAAAATTATPAAAPAQATATVPADPAAAPPPAAAPAAPAIASADSEPAPYKDGTYYGWGSCRHGDIQAAIVIEGGRMASATVAQCLTRYACSWIDPLLPHTVRSQAATADYVSGATESSEAFNDAVAEALAQAH